jgi:hypothetical protein
MASRLGQLVCICEFNSLVSPAPFILLSQLLQEKDEYEVVLVSLECQTSGDILCQQILKLTNPLGWSADTCVQWLQLVEHKFMTQGTLEPVC